MLLFVQRDGRSNVAALSPRVFDLPLFQACSLPLLTGRRLVFPEYPAPDLPTDKSQRECCRDDKDYHGGVDQKGEKAT
jgi:hypothetical protein